MKRMNWRWAAVVAAMLVPASMALAQSAALDLEATWFEAADDDVAWQEADSDGGGPMDHLAMRRIHGMGGHGGMGPGVRGPGMGRGPGRGHGLRLDALDLTEDQRTRIEAIHERARRNGIRARADLQLARLDLHKLMRADTPDRRAVEAQIDKLSEMRAAMQKAHLGVMFEARALLTDGQKKRLREMRNERPAMRGPRVRRGGEPESPDDSQ